MTKVLPDVSSVTTQVRRQLHAQLQDSHETRWHAAQLFTRYFYRLGSARSQATSPATALGHYSLTEDALLAHEGREVVTWDCAVASVALGVKVSGSKCHQHSDRADGADDGTVPARCVPTKLYDTGPGVRCACSSLDDLRRPRGMFLPFAKPRVVMTHSS